MALDKAALKSTLQDIFESINGDEPMTAAEAATKISNAIDEYVKTALATVVVPPGTFLIAATGGVPNPPILLTGGPATTPPGGLS